MIELDEIRQRIFALEQSANINEERIATLEEVALILRAKIEPETLKDEAIERAETIAREREVIPNDINTELIY